MPGIISHDFFGRDLLASHAQYAGAPDERFAFMLGCQGPDPLLYMRVDPRTRSWKPLACIFHDEKPAELLVALRNTVDNLAEEERSIGLAYARGFLAHYALDRQVHPLVYAQQYALCDAGIAGLEKKDGTYVHAVIESSIDEVVLFCKRHETIRVWKPYQHILHGSDEMITLVSRMYTYVAHKAYHLEPPETLFADALRCFRLIQRALYSPDPRRRCFISTAERLVQRHSLYDALSHRANASYVCAFDNHESALWQNPFTGRKSTLDFWSLYQQALRLTASAIEVFEQPSFGLNNARELTGNLNFSGEPVVVR